MSIKLMSVVWEIPLAPAQKLVLLALADNANDQGYCWPAVKTIYEKCCMGERTVRRCIGALIEARHITVHERPGRSSYYTVHPCQSGTPAKLTGAAVAGEACQPGTAPLPQGHPTPANVAPITIIEPSREPSGNLEIGSRGKRAHLATHIPDDFELTEKRRSIAVAERLDADREFANFRDHWVSASGARARKRDWDAAWRVWCRKSADMRPIAAMRIGGSSLSAAALEAQGLQKLKDRREAIGLATFRDPTKGETAEQYRKAQDDEYNRLQLEAQRRVAVGAVAALVKAKAVPK